VEGRKDKMKMKFDLDPTVPRVVIVAILIFAEALIVPLIALTSRGIEPTMLELCTILLVALLALVTYLMSFFHVEAPEKKHDAQ